MKNYIHVNQEYFAEIHVHHHITNASNVTATIMDFTVINSTVIFLLDKFNELHSPSYCKRKKTFPLFETERFRFFKHLFLGRSSILHHLIDRGTRESCPKFACR